VVITFGLTPWQEASIVTEISLHERTRSLQVGEAMLLSSAVPTAVLRWAS
jgi:hypothetical protein